MIYSRKRLSCRSMRGDHSRFHSRLSLVGTGNAVQSGGAFPPLKAPGRNFRRITAAPFQPMRSLSVPEFMRTLPFHSLRYSITGNDDVSITLRQIPLSRASGFSDAYRSEHCNARQAFEPNPYSTPSSYHGRRWLQFHRQWIPRSHRRVQNRCPPHTHLQPATDWQDNA